MDKCFQVCSTVSTATSLLHSHHSLSSKEKLVLPTTCKALMSSGSVSFSSSSLMSLRSPKPRRSKSGIVCKASVDQVEVVTETNWENMVMGSQIPVLVEFWAPWCGPCRMITPVIEELAKEYAGKISCFKVNTDDCPNIASKFGIRSIPTMLFFKNGEKKESVIGAVPKTTLSTTIEKYLNV